MNRHSLRGTLGRSAALTAALSAVALSAPLALADRQDVTPEQAIATAEALSVAFERAAAQVRDSVVSITTRREPEQRQQPMRQPFRNSPFRDFFGDDFFERFEMPPQQPQMGQGSGWIFREDGYIVTNAHVVAGADTVTVQFTDDRQMEAEVVGVDRQTDVAVLKVDQSGLAAVQIGDSDDLRIGQWVIAVGTPFGLDSTITAGIVSATGRSRVGLADYEDFIQTDAAINPGNSGGPLVNLRGEVVGMNTAIYTQNTFGGRGGNIGIGFAIPMRMIQAVAADLIEDGQVTRGFLGVNIQDLSEGLAQSFGFSGTEGVLVADVVDGTPAAEAGLQSGDIITSMNGRKVSDMNDLRMRVASTEPGTEVEFTFFREGVEKQATITIGKLDAEQPVASRRSEGRLEANLGLTVQTLDAATARQLEVDPNLGGAVVMNVQPGSDAQQAGLMRGDIILRVGQERVRTAEELRSALAEHDLKEGVRLTVRTGTANRFVFLQAR